MASNTGHIDPFWDLKQIQNVNYKVDYHKDVALVEQYVSAGHSKNHIMLWNYFQPNPMPVDTSLFEIFFPELSHISVAINKFTPGQYLPLHKDLYGRYCQVHNVNNVNSIKRVIIMIEHGYPGQILQIENQVWSNWKSGDWFSWIGEESHAIYNFSLNDRYAWQLTGIIK